MTRLDFMARMMTKDNLVQNNLVQQNITKQDLLGRGVIDWKTTGIFIRDARPSDQTAIRELTLAAYQEYAEPLGAYWEGYKGEMLRRLENVRPAQQLVVDDNGEIVATMLLYPAGVTFTAPDGEQHTAEFPEMRLLAVLPELRGRGLATLLMRECVERVRVSGAKTVMFHTIALMRAEPLYQRVGDFIRAPDFDFWMSPEARLECYRLDLEGK